MRSRLRPVLRSAAAVLLCCVWLVPARAVEKSSSYLAALESIKAEELGEHVGRLADEAMEGREAGTRGGHAAGDYLAAQYAALHLPGAGNEGGYFQPFAPNFRNVLAILRGSDPQLRDQVIRGRRPLRSHRLRRPRSQPGTVRLHSSRRRRQRQRNLGRAGVGQGVDLAFAFPRNVRSCSPPGTRKRKGCSARSTGLPIRPCRWSTSWRR